jgi:hypothetical protein
LTAFPQPIFDNFALLCQNLEETSEVKKLMRLLLPSIAAKVIQRGKKPGANPIKRLLE